MRYFLSFFLFYTMISCVQEQKKEPFSKVSIETLYTDSLSIKAIELLGNSLAFAADKGTFGTIDLTNGKVRANVEKYHTSIPEFRSVAHTKTDFFMLSVANPALLYKTGDNGTMQLVYKEEGDTVFYDAMTFWDQKEGIAIGDSMNGCLSIIITRDAGNTWHKLPCSQVPLSLGAEGAFAASNTNIKVLGNKVWIATTASRILYSPDRGYTWEVFQTPIVHEKETQGIYSIDFYDEFLGIAIGGDYTVPLDNALNKAITRDGGKTWQLLAEGAHPGYKSCLQFVPNSNGTEIVTVGFTGISYSSDTGATWKQLSDASFYTIRFKNDSVAYAAGKNRIAKLVFK